MNLKHLRKSARRKLYALGEVAVEELKEELTSEDEKISNKAANDILDRIGLNPKKTEAPPQAPPQQPINLNFMLEGLKTIKELSNDATIQLPASAEDETKHSDNFGDS